MSIKHCKGERALPSALLSASAVFVCSLSLADLLYDVRLYDGLRLQRRLNRRLNKFQAKSDSRDSRDSRGSRNSSERERRAALQQSTLITQSESKQAVLQRRWKRRGTHALIDLWADD